MIYKTKWSKNPKYYKILWETALHINGQSPYKQKQNAPPRILVAFTPKENVHEEYFVTGQYSTKKDKNEQSIL